MCVKCKLVNYLHSIPCKGSVVDKLYGAISAIMTVCSKVTTKCSACKYPWGFYTHSNQFHYVLQVAATA